MLHYKLPPNVVGNYIQGITIHFFALLVYIFFFFILPSYALIHYTDSMDAVVRAHTHMIYYTFHLRITFVNTHILIHTYETVGFRYGWHAGYSWAHWCVGVHIDIWWFIICFAQWNLTHMAHTYSHSPHYMYIRGLFTGRHLFRVTHVYRWVHTHFHYF